MAWRLLRHLIRLLEELPTALALASVRSWGAPVTIAVAGLTAVAGLLGLLRGVLPGGVLAGALPPLAEDLADFGGLLGRHGKGAVKSARSGAGLDGVGLDAWAKTAAECVREWFGPVPSAPRPAGQLANGRREAASASGPTESGGNVHNRRPRPSKPMGHNWA